MVKNPRKKTGLSRIRPLNQPVGIEVEEGENQGPAAIVSRGRRMGVTSVGDVWEIIDEWWRADSVARRYYRVTVETGATITVFRDLFSGAWYEQKV